MQVRNPRKAITMARRFLETSLLSSQKGKMSHFSPTRKQAPYSHLSLNPSRSSLSSTISAPSISVRAPSLSQTHIQHAPPQPSTDQPHHSPKELAHGMPKHKARVVLATYEGTKVDWGTVAGAALREGLHTFQDGKKLRPIIHQYLTILYPPRTLPALPPRPSRCRLEDLAKSTWEDESTVAAQRSPTPHSRRRSPTPPTNSNAPQEEA